MTNLYSFGRAICIWPCDGTDQEQWLGIQFIVWKNGKLISVWEQLGDLRLE